MRLSSVNGLHIALLTLCAAVWPVWRWYALRLTDGSDEPWGLLALGTLALLMWRRVAPGGDTFKDRRLGWSAVCIALYAAAFPFVPPLARAIFAAAALGSLLFRGVGSAGLWGLLALSMPVIATLQFYIGYPLRVLAAEASIVTLRLCGFALVREGSLLHWAGKTVMVDAPCSGVQMLWFGFYCAFACAAFCRLSLVRTACCAVLTLAIIVAANMARATVLFCKEAGIVAWPEWTHAGAGLLLFAMAAWLIAAMTQKLQPQPCVL